MVKQILIYTRPWEVNFHMELAKILNTKYPHANLSFVTFFSKTHELILSKGFSSILFTEELKKITDLQSITQIDEELNISFNLNLNLLAGMERYLPQKSKESEIFITKHTMVLDKLITENTLSISSMYDHFIYLLAGLLTNIRNGYHFSFVACGMPPNRVIALKTPWQTWHTNYSKDFSDLLLKECFNKLEIPTEQRISYMNINWNTKIHKRIFKTIREYYESHEDFVKGNYFSITPKNRLNIIKELYIKKIFNKKFIFEIENLNDLNNVKSEFIFCPLHMEPEATILMYSPWLRNQIEMCRLISQALPFGVKLLVKENPKMKNIRPKSFYDDLSKLPNIILVSPSLDSKEILKKSKGVVTLAGTASIEAAVLEKRSMCIATPPFSNVVDFSDFVNNFKLSNLNLIFRDWLNNPKKEIDKNNWHDWVCSTFDANLVPNYNDVSKVVEILPSKANVLNTLNFIESCIKK